MGICCKKKTMIGFSLVYLLAWHPPLHTPYISSPNRCLLFTVHAHTIATCFAVVLRLCHLILVSLSRGSDSWNFLGIGRAPLNTLHHWEMEHPLPYCTLSFNRVPPTESPHVLFTTLRTDCIGLLFFCCNSIWQQHGEVTTTTRQ